MKKFIIITFLWLGIICLFNVCQAGTIELPRTGQTKCYNNQYNSVIECNQSGQDGEWQAGIPWPNPRFTDNGDGTITDNLTGLMWKAQPLSRASMPDASKNCSILNFAGYDDWRVANVNEYLSLSRAGVESIVEWLNAQGFILPEGNSSIRYWTSTHAGLTMGWYCDIYDYHPSIYSGFSNLRIGDHRPQLAVRGDSTGSSKVWRTGINNCVIWNEELKEYQFGPCAGTGQDGEYRKGASWPSPRFVDHGDGTVTDRLTELMWLKDANCMATHHPEFDTYDTPGDGSVTWMSSFNFIKGINNGKYNGCSAGYMDWRLCNIKELGSLIDYSSYQDENVLPDGHPFENISIHNTNQAYAYKTSTCDVGMNGVYPLSIPMGDGEIHHCGGIPCPGIVWPVRLGNTANLWLSEGPQNPSDDRVSVGSDPVRVIQISLSNSSYAEDAVLVSSMTFTFNSGGGNIARIEGVELYLEDSCEINDKNLLIGTGFFGEDNTVTFSSLNEQIDPGVTLCYSLRYRFKSTEPSMYYGANISYSNISAAGANGDVPVMGDGVEGSIRTLPPAQTPKSGTVKDPIDTGKGTFYFNTLDLNTGGPLPLFFSRYYNTNFTNGDVDWTDLGPRWIHNFYIGLSASDEEVNAYIQNGAIINFKKEDEQWILNPAQDILYQYKRGVDERHYVMDPSREVIYIFDSQGRIAYIVDRNSNRHAFIRNDDGQVIEIEDGFGRSLAFSYDEDSWDKKLTEVAVKGTDAHISFIYDDNDRLNSFTNAAGNTTEYTYPEDSPNSYLIVSITRGQGNTPNTQTYDADDRVQTQTDAYGNTTQLDYHDDGSTEIIYPDESVKKHTHQNSDLLVGYEDESGKDVTIGYDSDKHRTSVTDRMGDSTSVEYDPESGKLLSITNSNGEITSFKYIVRDQVFVDPDPDVDEDVHFTFYDLICVTHPDGTHEDFTQDARGNLLTQTDQSGNSWTYTYNDSGQPLTITNPVGGIITYTYNDDATLSSSTDSDTGITTYVYDEYKRPILITYPDGGKVDTTYDLNDQVTSTIDELGNTFSYTYDLNGNLTVISDPEGRRTLFEYDLMDRLSKVTDKIGGTTTYTYDEMGRVASVTGPMEQNLEIKYNLLGLPEKTVGPDGKLWEKTYDAEAILTSMTSPSGNEITFQTNKLGQLTKTVGPLANTTIYEYDVMGRMTSVTDANGISTSFNYHDTGLPASISMDLFGASVYYTWNNMGNIAQIKDLNGKSWQFGYTVMGRLSHEDTPSGRRTVYNYDTMGRISSMIHHDGQEVFFTYDAAGNLTSWGSGESDLTYIYDTLNHLLVSEGISFSYNAEGMVTSAADTTGTSEVSFESVYDNAGRISELSYKNGLCLVKYEYDVDNHLSKVTDTLSGAEVAFIYDDNGGLVSVSRSNGIKTDFTWDESSRLVGIEHGELANMDYLLDSLGKVMEADLDLPLEPAEHMPLAGKNELTFDDDSQISSAGYAYDDRGRLLQTPRTTFTWDWADRLSSAGSAYMTYNGTGDLVTKQIGSIITHYYYSHSLGMNPILLEKHEEGEVERCYVWAPQGHLLYMIDVVNNRVYFYHFDREGNTVFLTNGSGEITDSYAYSSYGMLLGHNGDNEQPFTFVGKYGVRSEEAVQDLYHMRSRFYDAGTSRFLSVDSEWPNILMVKNLNPYQYAELDPISISDPLGAGPVANGTKALGKALAKDIFNLLSPTPTQVIGNIYNGTPQGFVAGGAAIVNKESVPDIIGEAFVSLTIGAYLDAVGMNASFIADGTDYILSRIGEERKYEDMGFQEKYFEDLERMLNKMSKSRRAAHQKFLHKNARVMYDLFKQWQNRDPVPVGGGAFDPTSNTRLDMTGLSRTGASRVIPLMAVAGVLGINKGAHAVEKTVNTVAFVAKKIAAAPFKAVVTAQKWLKNTANPASPNDGYTLLLNEIKD